MSGNNEGLSSSAADFGIPSFEIGNSSTEFSDYFVQEYFHTTTTPSLTTERPPPSNERIQNLARIIREILQGEIYSFSGEQTK